MISDKRILQLWRDPTFSGSYRGIKTFQLLLKTDLNIDVSEKKLYSVIKTDPLFLIHQRPKRNFLRRSYDIRFYGELLQADIAYMFEYDNFKYFLLVIDCFSSKIFVEPLKDKSAESVKKAFEIITNEMKAPIQELQTDQGKEFIGCKKYFKEKRIYFKPKYGKNKANFAEWGILNIKKRLYKMLRGNLTQDWPQFIKKVVNDHNNTPLKKLGWLKPNDINNEFDSIKVENAQKQINYHPYREPKLDIRTKNQLSYENDNTKLQKGSYVYLDFKETLFGKSFDVQVCKFLYFAKKEKETVLVSCYGTTSNGQILNCYQFFNFAPYFVRKKVRFLTYHSALRFLYSIDSFVAFL